MIDKLPYELTLGVTATRETLSIDTDVNPFIYYALNGAVPSGGERIMSWAEASSRLRYRKGEPWCARYSPSAGTYNGTCILVPDDGPALHRLAAIVCNDANGFIVLHWCIHNLA